MAISFFILKIVDNYTVYWLLQEANITSEPILQHILYFYKNKTFSICTSSKNPKRIMISFVHVKQAPFELLKCLAYKEWKEKNFIPVTLIPVFLIKREKDKLEKWYDHLSVPWENNLGIVTTFIKRRLISLNLIWNRFAISEIYIKLDRHNILSRGLNGLYIVEDYIL